jgi:hypothetical protein
MYGIYSFTGFRGQHHSRPDPVPHDIPDDVLPDPDDLADFELPDQQALINAFLDGLYKESDHEFRGLTHLLARLPDPNLSQGHPNLSHRRSRVFLDFLCMDGDE